MSDQAHDMTGTWVDPTALIAERGHVLKTQTQDRAISALPGGFAIRRRGHGQVIADSRAYVSGDDVRHVDRGATARTGSLHIRTFQEERDRVTFLVADFRPSMLWGMRRAFRSVAAAHALARLGWQAVESGGRVGLLAITATGSVVVPTRGRTRGMLAVIGGMVKAHADAVLQAKDGLEDPPLDAALSQLKLVVPRGAAVMIATGLDTVGATFDDQLAELAERRFPRLIVIEDGGLRALPSGYYPVGLANGRRANVWVNAQKEDAAADPQHASAIPTIMLDSSAEISNGILSLGH